MSSQVRFSGSNYPPQYSRAQENSVTYGNAQRLMNERKSCLPVLAVTTGAAAIGGAAYGYYTPPSVNSLSNSLAQAIENGNQAIISGQQTGLVITNPIASAKLYSEALVKDIEKSGYNKVLNGLKQHDELKGVAQIIENERSLRTLKCTGVAA